VYRKRGDRALLTAMGLPARELFSHEVIAIAKPYPDSQLMLERRGVSRRRQRRGAFTQLNLYSLDLHDLPEELFTHPEVNWHGQQLGRLGLIAAAGLFVEGSRATVATLQSDFCQQLHRHIELKAAWKTRIERHFGHWYVLLFNAILDFCLDTGVTELYSPTGSLVAQGTEKAISPQLFFRIYDHPTTRYDCASAVVGGASYWKLSLAGNAERVARLVPVTGEAAVRFNKPAIAIFHDIEENVDTPISVAACQRHLAQMLEIEQESGVDATYTVLGALMSAKLGKIRSSNPRHAIGFHSYDHGGYRQLRKCREVDLRIRGYRPPRSRMTSELTDGNLTYLNFEWLASSAASLELARCRLENGLVKIPIHLDDYPLHIRAMEYEAWEGQAIEALQIRPFLSLSLHDCYAEHWLPHYPRLLEKLGKLGQFATADSICDGMLLGMPGAPYAETDPRKPVDAIRRVGRLIACSRRSIAHLRNFKSLHWDASHGGNASHNFRRVRSSTLPGTDPASPAHYAECDVAVPQSSRGKLSLLPSAPTKVLVLIPSLEIGGIEMDLVRTLPLLNRGRFEVVVGAIERRGPLATVLSEAGIDVIGPISSESSDRGLFHLALWAACAISRFALRVVPHSSNIRLLHVGLKYLLTGSRVARHLTEGRFDILHAVSPSAYIIGALAIGWPKRQSLLMSRVSLAFYQRGARLFGAVERLAHRRVDFVTGNARAILVELAAEGIPDRKMRLLRNGIDVAAFTQSMVGRAEARALLGISPDALVFTSVANLFPYKGHADLLDALHRLMGSLPGDWYLLVAGRDVGGNLEKLRQQAAQQGLSRHVLFLGVRRDVPVILSAGDIHVSASHFEGFPNNVTEAMCAGLPVVATAVGGVPEQIDDGSTGLLVPPHEPAALASALLDLARDPDRRKTLGLAARLRVAEQFPLRATVRALEDAYTSIARTRRQWA